jgi:hypothetical protein
MSYELTITLPQQGERLKTELKEPDKDMFDELKEQYGFTHTSQAARCFLKLGMMSAVDNDPRHSTASQPSEEFSPVTIRQLIPEGTENAVEMTDEFWEQILRDEMLDIVSDDPEIKRDGFKIYR